MKERVTISILVLVALFLTLAPTILASTTWYVNGTNGSDSHNCMSSATACKTIGHAISLAASGDTVMVAAATYTENLAIGINLNVIGAGAGTTIIDGNGTNIVIDIYNSSVVTLSNITIRHGFRSFGAGIDNQNGVLTINNGTISGNTSFVIICCAYGAGIYNGGVLTINNSTISGNDTGCGHIGCATQGAGIYNVGKAVINNSTIVGNIAYGHFLATQGGGIYNVGVALINNSTLNGNVATLGGGIYGLAWFQNSIVAGNGKINCSRTQNSHGYNLSSDNTCNFSGPGDRNSTDPLLGTLGNYGGPTQTIPLLIGSPAIDAGNPSGCTDRQGHLLKTDQRGYPRPDTEDKTGCDMGAYERQSD